jgi:hypothetical protein
MELRILLKMINRKRERWGGKRRKEKGSLTENGLAYHVVIAKS